MSRENVVDISNKTGYKVRFPDESNIFHEEPFHRSMVCFSLNHNITITNNYNEQDLDSYNEGGHGIQIDKRELGHRYAYRSRGADDYLKIAQNVAEGCE